MNWNVPWMGLHDVKRLGKTTFIFTCKHCRLPWSCKTRSLKSRYDVRYRVIADYAHQGYSKEPISGAILYETMTKGCSFSIMDKLPHFVPMLSIRVEGMDWKAIQFCCPRDNVATAIKHAIVRQSMFGHPACHVGSGISPILSRGACRFRPTPPQHKHVIANRRENPEPSRRDCSCIITDPVV